MKEQCPTVNNLVSRKVYTIGVGVQLRSDTAPPRRSTDAEKNHGLPFLPLRVGVKISSLSEFANENGKR